MPNRIISRYTSLCNIKGDINEHLPTLRKYASQCESILELGVRGCVSSWAFAYGLLENKSHVKKMIMNDIDACDVSDIVNICCNSNSGIDIKYVWVNDLELDVTNINVDLVFIDTWHVYPQLKKELEIYSKIANKYIIMHDTEIDGEFGESIRSGSNIEEQSIQTGFSVEDISCGLQKAIDEFLLENNSWVLHECFKNNNGLTILHKQY